MFHFLAQFGRARFVGYIMPVTCAIVPSVYILYQNQFNHITKRFLIAESRPGQPEELSEHVVNLIHSTLQDLEGKFNMPVGKSQVFKNEAKITWFASSTFDPITVGMIEGRSGALIGLPNYYNYRTKEELPSNLFEFRKIRLFKFKDSGEKSKEPIDKTADSTYVAQQIDREDPESNEYIKSLLLSDKAKKYGIARELFVSESWAPLFKFLIMLTMFSTSYLVARRIVFARRLMEAHISQRIPIYILATTFGLGSATYTIDVLNIENTLRFDRKAAELGPDYLLGAEEYFKKTIRRNQALHNLLPDFDSVDQFGNYKNPLIRARHFPLTGRLEKILKLGEEGEEDGMKDEKKDKKKDGASN